MKATIAIEDHAIVEMLVPEIDRIVSERLKQHSEVGGGKRLLRAKDVMQLTGMSRSGIYRDPTFPKQMKIGERMVAWDQQEILDWMAARKGDRT